MKTSTKILAAVAATLALGGTGLVLAQQGGQGRDGQGMHQGKGMHKDGNKDGHKGGHGMGQRGGDASARLTALKTELAITAEQEPAWQAFETVVREQTTARQALHDKMRASKPSPNAVPAADRSARREAMQEMRKAHQAQRETARQALLAVLTPEQKSVAEERLASGHGGRQGHRAHVGKDGQGDKRGRAS